MKINENQWKTLKIDEIDSKWECEFAENPWKSKSTKKASSCDENRRAAGMLVAKNRWKSTKSAKTSCPDFDENRPTVGLLVAKMKLNEKRECGLPKPVIIDEKWECGLPKPGKIDEKWECYQKLPKFRWKSTGSANASCKKTMTIGVRSGNASCQNSTKFDE